MLHTIRQGFMPRGFSKKIHSCFSYIGLGYMLPPGLGPILQHLNKLGRGLLYDVAYQLSRL